ncbi:type VII secretion protein EccCa [Natronoglycomyces albus]|uniref:Type VII secretion protein EccCa n=1 Tax=Natronoglycomyces albus TaxID=2811108 RepID=A0A895XUZ5_9ACTN|nr:type VII secretion protein EccCa [Natronoglycomyces albus]
MGLRVFKRRPRLSPPALPEGELELQEPPELPDATGKDWSRAVMVIPMMAGVGGMMMMFAFTSTGGDSTRVTLRIIVGAVFMVGMLAMVLMTISRSGKGGSKREQLALRRKYLRTLSRHRQEVRDNATKQHAHMTHTHPDPSSLWTVVSGPRLWERRSGDDDFATVRIGTGEQELATPLKLPASKPVADLEPGCALALRKFVETYGIVKGLPIAVDLRGYSRIYFYGDHEQQKSLARAILAQAATWHTPDDLLIGVVANKRTRIAWEWVKWLPHNLHPDRTDALGAVRLFGNSYSEIDKRAHDLLEPRPRFNPDASPFEGPHFLVITDKAGDSGDSQFTGPGDLQGVTMLTLGDTPPAVLDPGEAVIDLNEDGTLRLTSAELTGHIGNADTLSVPEAETLSRELAPVRLSGGTADTADVDDDSSRATPGFCELLAIGDALRYDPDHAWRKRSERNMLRVPIGVDPSGLPVELDFKEAAQNGMGPHGLLIGATGSGKSEVLRTMTLALAAVHSPEYLNFVLVDFKGGATFTKLDKLPHTSAVITNLSDELVLVDRMKDAIAGETRRRQELLRSAGNYASLKDYEKARNSGKDLEPLPTLLIICDEFSELLEAKPDFIEMFGQIGRVGRSLGVHLLLASQRLEESKLRGLQDHLSYRVGLRTFSAAESRTVLGVPDAFNLPSEPGHGYLSFAGDDMQRFRASYVSGPYKRSSGPLVLESDDSDPVMTYTSNFVKPKPKPSEDDSDDDEADTETLLDLLVGKMEGKGMPAHQVWLDPLNESPTMDELLPPLEVVDKRGYMANSPELWGKLRVPVAIVDKPFEQRRDVHWIDFTGSAGNLAIAGGSRSGKSTLLRTIITSLALTHTPEEAQFYCLDFGGGALSSLRELPHVGGVYQRLDADQVRRTVAEVVNVLEARERRFSELGIDSMATYRKMRADGTVTDDPYGDVFLVVDGWSVLRDEFDPVHSVIAHIVQRGLAYGIHVLAAASRWPEIKVQIKELFGSKLELKVGDPFDSYVKREVAKLVNAGQPGRGVTPDELQYLAALPRVDSDSDPESLLEGVKDVVAKVKGGWKKASAPKVRLLPDELAYADLPVEEYQGKRDKWRIPVGLAEADLEPVYVDFANEPHFMMFSDTETGKSSFLRQLVTSVQARTGEREAKFILIDYRRSLLGAVNSRQLVKHCSTASHVKEVVSAVTEVSRERLPPDNVTPQQLRERSWWSGPEMFIIIDDYDLVASGFDNPLTPLVEFIPQGRDIGLHIVVTRRSGGAAKSLFDGFIGGMKNLGTPGFQGSVPRSEGDLLTKAGLYPPGRGMFITRKATQLVQMAWLPPEE